MKTLILVYSKKDLKGLPQTAVMLRESGSPRPAILCEAALKSKAEKILKTVFK